MELKEKIARKDLLENTSNAENTKEIPKIIPEPKRGELHLVIYDNLEQFDFSEGFRSIFQKNLYTSYMKD